MVGQASSSSSWPAATSATTSAHQLSQEYNSLLATSYPTAAHPSQASFQGEQSKYLAAGLATEAKYGLMSEAKYGMGDPVGLETKYSSHLASQSQGVQVQKLPQTHPYQMQEDKQQQYLNQLAAQSMCRPVH